MPRLNRPGRATSRARGGALGGSWQPSRQPGPHRTPADVEAAIPFGLQVAAGLAWRLIVVVIAGWGLVLGLAATSTVAIPVAVALLLTALFMPVQVRLNRRLGLPRHGAAAITVLGGLAVILGLLGVAGNQVVMGIASLSSQIRTGVQQIQEWLVNGPFQLGNDQLEQVIQQGNDWLHSNSSTLTSGALRAGSSAGEFLAGTIIALIATFFFLAEGDAIWGWFMRLLPSRVQEPVHEAFRRGWVSLGSYVKTQVLVAAIDAVGIAVGAFVLGLPLVIPLGLIVFFASAVPIVGAVVSGALAVVLALVVKGPVTAVIMLGVVLLVQQVESHLLQPLLMGKAVSLHPLAVLLGVAAFSFLMGIVGALFAVPVLAVANTVVLYLTGHDKFPLLAQGHSAVEVSARKLAVRADAPAAQDVTDREPQVGDATPENVAEHRDATTEPPADR